LELKGIPPINKKQKQKKNMGITFNIVKWLENIKIDQSALVI